MRASQKSAIKQMHVLQVLELACRPVSSTLVNTAGHTCARGTCNMTLRQGRHPVLALL